MKGKTSKPCPGCGAAGWRAADKVCGECQTLLAEARTARAALDRDPARGNYVLAWQYYSLPHFHYQGNAEHGKSFQMAFHRLCQLLSVPVAHVWKSQCAPVVEGLRESDRAVSLSIEIRDCLNELYQSARRLNQAAHDAGDREGHSFVLKMARGEVSIDEYNKATAGE